MISDKSIHRYSTLKYSGWLPARCLPLLGQLHSNLMTGAKFATKDSWQASQYASSESEQRMLCIALHLHCIQVKLFIEVVLQCVSNDSLCLSQWRLHHWWIKIWQHGCRYGEFLTLCTYFAHTDSSWLLSSAMFVITAQYMNQWINQICR